MTLSKLTRLSSRLVLITLVLATCGWMLGSDDSPFGLGRRSSFINPASGFNASAGRESSSSFETSPFATASFVPFDFAGAWTFAEFNWDVSTTPMNDPIEATRQLTDAVSADSAKPNTCASKDESQLLRDLFLQSGADKEMLHEGFLFKLEEPYFSAALFTKLDGDVRCLRILTGAGTQYTLVTLTPNIVASSSQANGSTTSKSSNHISDIPWDLQLPDDADVLATRRDRRGKVDLGIIKTRSSITTLLDEWEASGWSIRANDEVAGQWVAGRANQHFSVFCSRSDDQGSEILISRM